MNQPDANSPGHPPEIDPAIRETAARWIVRRDRGLSATESIEFELWLADDERHVAALRRATAAWGLLDRLPDSVGQSGASEPARTAKGMWWSVGGLAAGLAIAAYLVLGRPTPGANPKPGEAVSATHVFAAEPAAARVMTLPDGTTLRLNAGSEVVEHFTAAERRVRITRGEAHFTVTKNPQRPFVVRAGNIEVKAVGTAFNVNLQSTTVEVLVTEGSVQVQAGDREASVAPAAATTADKPPSVVGVGQRASVALNATSLAAAVVVSDVKPDEMAKVLAWQSSLLRLGGATLAELAVEFQRQTGQRIELVDAELASLRIGGSFRADDVDGFVRLLEENYGVKSRRTSDGTILLRKNP